MVNVVDITLTSHHEGLPAPKDQGVPLLNSRVARQEFLSTALTAQAPIQRLKTYDTVISKAPFLLVPMSDDARRIKEERRQLAEERSQREVHITSKQAEAQSKTEALWCLQREIREILSVALSAQFNVCDFRMSEVPPLFGGTQDNTPLIADSFQYILQAQRHNAEIEAMLKGLSETNPDSVRSYFLKVLERSPYPQGFNPAITIDFDSVCRELTVSVVVVGPGDMPAISEYVYLRPSDTIIGKKLPRAALKTMYENYIGAVTIRIALEIARANENEVVRSLSLRTLANNFVAGTSRYTSVPVVEWAPTWAEIEDLISEPFGPKSMLNLSSAVVSKNLLELSPISVGKGIRRV